MIFVNDKWMDFEETFGRWPKLEDTSGEKFLYRYQYRCSLI